MMTIRRRLLLLLMPALTLLMLVGGVVDYRIAVVSTRDAYDRALFHTALALAAGVQVENGQLRFAGNRSSAALDGATLFAVMAPDGSLLAGQPELAAAARAFGAAPSPPAAVPSRVSIRDVQLLGRPWRASAVTVPGAAGAVRIAVAETLERRAHTQQVMLIGKLLVDFAELDLILLLAWIAVYWGLRPLQRLASDVERRPALARQRFDLTQVPGEVRGLVSSFNRLLELLHAAAQAQQRFVADAAHQMRTPVAGLLAQLELLLHEPVARPIAGQLGALQRGIQQLARAANQLLSLARAEPVAALHEGFRETALKPLIEELVGRSLDRADQAGIDLGAEALDLRVQGDAGLLQDLLDNLVDNALKYTPRGGRVTVRSAMDGSAACLEVEDDGPGIPEALRGRVRERFYRMPGASGIGCGLGLAIVEEIARVHGATFSIGSGATGQGARMRVRFGDAPRGAQA